MENRPKFPIVFFQEEPLQGKFKISKTIFGLCNKFIDVFLKIDNENFSLAYDEKHTKKYIIINCHDIISINKRQIDKYDINKISIYYKDRTILNGVKELKLKVLTRGDFLEWLDLLKFKITPKKFEFNFSKKKEKKLQSLSTIQLNPWKLFYVVNSLDVYLLKKREYIFFQNLQDFLNRKLKSHSYLSSDNSLVDLNSLQEIALDFASKDEVKSLGSKFDDENEIEESNINIIPEQSLMKTMDKINNTENTYHTESKINNIKVNTPCPQDDEEISLKENTNPESND